MTSRGHDAFVAAAFAAFVTLVVPLQSFIGNASLYPYSMVRILLELGVLFVVGFAVIFALLRVMGRFLGAYPQAFIVGLPLFALLAILQSHLVFCRRGERG